ILRSFNPDLFVVVAYGEIIKEQILNIPSKGCINIHASLLPSYRGAAPMQRCLMDGVSKTGISIIEMTPQMDAGDILAIQALPVSLETTLGDLEPRLCHLGCDLVLQTIREIDRGSACKIPQNHSLATLAPKMRAEEELIDWKKPAYQIHNLIRALSPSPGAWCPVQIGAQERRLKIKRSQLEPGIQAAPGTLVQFSQEGVVVACGEGGLRLLELQLEGKKNLCFSEFVRGIHLPIRFL
ncbi:MAG: methionyl-tRNA formyltransferase, partial [Chlamydiales bacterium]|nr:methionyl-tRNA formyltransferase [Chlamydiales bacterium]